MQRMSWKQSAISGLLFAVGISLWDLFRHSPEMGELATRFAFSFVTFTVGYRFILNRLARREAQDR
ncbi:hypothetical protein [Aurantiacibacter zhengii]|uniref:Uncharacterized protein n=1 Tax=Aurantiacibacter zhengii TaxID=2307003 RepID=A0A418NU58_9SPHN|nr:hypothetical protein [Aurantiacibacter zhengii]RIV87616.1 hypothetical protein D2V07_04540 [Aurantiacibacter zhengii]